VKIAKETEHRRNNFSRIYNMSLHTRKHEGNSITLMEFILDWSTNIHNYILSYYKLWVLLGLSFLPTAYKHTKIIYAFTKRILLHVFCLRGC